MRGLKAYLRFDADSFFAEKILTVTEVTKWVDFDTKEPMGTKVGVFISEDNSTYTTPKDGGSISAGRVRLSQAALSFRQQKRPAGPMGLPFFFASLFAVPTPLRRGGCPCARTPGSGWAGRPPPR